MNFKELLKSKGITQSKLASELVKFECYKYQQQISEWVNGVRLPDLQSARYISKIVGVSLDELADSLNV